MTGVQPAHARLRAATAAGHARVDGCFPDGLRDAEDYRRYLRGMAALLAALAAADAELADAFIAQRGRLAQDMQATGTTAMPAPTASVLAGNAGRLGARYVVEGSALGARVLLRQAQALGHGPAHGASFLAYHAERGRTHWPRLLQALAACDADGAAFPALLAGARDSFALAAACLAPVGGSGGGSP